MKWFYVVVLGLVYAGAPLLGVGESCILLGDFEVSSFNVSPYPIKLNLNYTVSMTGKFTKTELLDQVTIGVRQDITWRYTFDDINTNYLKDDIVTFNYTIEGPKSVGDYLIQISLHRPDYSMFGCWELGYIII
jgi:hypothetical protein